MRRLAEAALGFALAAIWTSMALGQGAGQPQAKQPFEIVRSIQAIQDQIVLGNANAKAKLPQVIMQLSERLLAAKPEVWRDAKNARAAIVYTLSGGTAKVIRKVIEIGLSPAPDLELMRATLAYVEGRHDEAKKSLSQIDASALAPAVGGHIAMIQSALIAKDDPREALRLLDKARVMLPGTLVEEAALRRALILAEEVSDIDKFAALSSEYVWRFPNSEYFESFRQQFAAAVIHFSLAADSNESAKIEKLIGILEPASRLRLYLQIGYRGIIGGKAGAALVAAVKAKQLSQDGTPEQTRAAFYEAAALLLTGNFESGVAELNSVDARRLPRQDVELKDATTSLAKMIGDPSGKVSAPAVFEAAEAAIASPNAAGASASASALIDLVQQKLGQTDEVLTRRSP
jgi:chemotaxis protein MotC